VDLHDSIDGIVEVIEREVVRMYKDKFVKPPTLTTREHFKASVMAEIARRIRARAVAIEEGQDK